MKIRTRKIIYSLVGLLIVGILMYQISLWTQKKVYEKYGMDFNSKRKEIGLKEISQDWNVEKLTWEDWNRLGGIEKDAGLFSKLIEIYLLSDIQTGAFYENNLVDNGSFYKSKVVWFNTNILFWRNRIESETDYYEKKIDSADSRRIGYLTIRYYVEDDNGNKDYFETNYIQAFEGTLFDGTAEIMEREEQRKSGKPYFGNINKHQADSILSSWNAK